MRPLRLVPRPRGPLPDLPRIAGARDVSRYQRVEIGPLTHAELEAGLAELGLTGVRADPAVGLMLAGSLECAGEPVDLRLAAGTLGAVEDFGFLFASGGPPALVCGEFDRALLSRRLLAPLAQAVARARTRELAADADLELVEDLEQGGVRRLHLRPRR